MLDSQIRYIVEKALDGNLIEKEEIAALFKVPVLSEESFYIRYASRKLSEMVSEGKAEIHGHVGVNVGPCPKNCKFCSFAVENKVFPKSSILPIEYIVEKSLDFEKAGANAIYLMATGTLKIEQFIEIAQEVRKNLQADTVLIANVGDFDYKAALKFKDAGINGVYHAIRLGEGKVTKIDPALRIKSFNATKEAGLPLGTCIEPVGPEHTVEELVEKTIIHREVNPTFSGAMKRVSIPNTELAKYGMKSEFEMAHILSVVRLATGHETKGNCTHEPNVIGAASGANLLWAETGTSPRDIKVKTEENRGADVEKCRQIYKEANWEVLEGPSKIWS